MKKILLLTVPHTGTVFVHDFLKDVLNLKHYQGMNIDQASVFMETDNTNIFARIHTTSPTRLIQEAKGSLMEYAENNCNVVIPLRNPVDSAISCIARKHHDLVYCTSCWEIMLEMYPRYNVFWIDINVKPELRHNMMTQLCEFLDCSPANSSEFNEYIDKWQKRNSVDYQNGIPPKNFDFDSLDFAVQWYDDMKIKLDKQYSMPLPMD